MPLISSNYSKITSKINILLIHIFLMSWHTLLIQSHYGHLQITILYWVSIIMLQLVSCSYIVYKLYCIQGAVPRQCYNSLQVLIYLYIYEIHNVPHKHDLFFLLNDQLLVSQIVTCATALPLCWALNYTEKENEVHWMKAKLLSSTFYLSKSRALHISPLMHIRKWDRFSACSM